jgi:hypothetical protein
MSYFQKVISEVIPIEECYINMGPVLNSFGAMSMWNVA